jgi:hypothetical protein
VLQAIALQGVQNETINRRKSNAQTILQFAQIEARQAYALAIDLIVLWPCYHAILKW